jgi:hypothetical protein
MPRRLEGLPLGVLDDEAEGLGIEGSATTKVGDSQGDVAAAHDVEGRIEGVFWNGLGGSKDEGPTGRAAF